MHFWGQENKASVKDNNDQEPFDTVGKLLKDEIGAPIEKEKLRSKTFLKGLSNRKV